MPNKGKEFSIEGLTRAFMNERSVYTAEKLLDKLVASTNSENLPIILDTMRAEPNFHELDMSLFINAVAKPELPLIKKIIADLRETFKDPDALEDLDEAEKNLQTRIT